MKTRASRPEAWFEKAEHDLVMVQRAMVGDDVPWDMVTFHAQQAAEKCLKGFLVARGVNPPKIHDLRSLLALCREHDATLASLDDDCHALSLLGWISQYPDSPEDPTEGEARRAIEIARRVREEVLRREAPTPQS